MSNSEDKTSDRRAFLKAIGAAGAVAGTMPLAAVSAAAEKPMTMPMPAAAPADAPPPAGYIFFNYFEALFIEAAVDTLVPSDATGPGALELGVATYIDRQLAGGFGKGARLYLQGPFAEGTPEQGYQLPMNPSELIRGGKVELATVPAAAFFARLLALTMEGYFGDPIYGGTRGKGLLEDDRFSGRERHVQRQDRGVPQQALSRRAQEHQGSELRGVSW